MKAVRFLAGVALVAFLAGPLLWLIVVGGRSDAWAQLDRSVVVQASLNTLLYAVAVTVVCGVLAVGFAFVLTRTDFALRRTLSLFLHFPVALPAVLLAMGQFDVWSLRSGLFAGYLKWPAMTGFAGMVLVTSVAYLPWVLAPLSRAISRTDPALEEAARVSGASATQAFLHATWPLVRAEWWASVLLVFSMTAATFGVPYFLGSLSSSRFPTLTTEMVSVVSVGGDNGIAQALWLGVPLALVSGVVLWASEKFRTKRSGDAGRAASFVRGPLGAAWPIVLMAWMYVSVGLLLPLAALLARATASDAGLPLSSSRTLHSFSALLSESATLAAVGRSLVLAVTGSLLVVVLGSASALMPRDGAQRAARRSAAVVYALPGTLLALGWLFFAASQLRVVFFNQLTVSFALGNTMALLLFGYLSKYLSAGIETATAAFARVGPSLVEASRMSGASAGRAAWSITVPLSAPSLWSLGALLFMTMLPELTMSVLLFGPRTSTAGTTLFDLATYTDPGQAAALAVMLALLCVVLYTWMSKVTDHE